MQARIRRRLLRAGRTAGVLLTISLYAQPQLQYAMEGRPECQTLPGGTVCQRVNTTPTGPYQGLKFTLLYNYDPARCATLCGKVYGRGRADGTTY